MDIDAAEPGQFEDGLGQDLTVSRNDDHVGRELLQRLDEIGFAHPLGLVQGKPELLRGQLYRRRRDGPAPACGFVRSGDDARQCRGPLRPVP